MSQTDDGFALPDWKAPLDAAHHIALAPEDGKTKGLFFQDLVEQAAAFGVLPEARDRYVPFIDYPLREYMALLVSGAGRIHPREPLRNGLRLLGRTAYPKLASTLIGKTIFGVAGRDFGAILDLASRAYAVSVSPGTVSLTEREGLRARVELRQIWSFPDAYQVGVFEGALIALGRSGQVKVRALSPCDVDFEVTWVE